MVGVSSEHFNADASGQPFREKAWQTETSNLSNILYGIREAGVSRGVAVGRLLSVEEAQMNSEDQHL